MRVGIESDDSANYTILVDREIVSTFWVPYFLYARAKDPLSRLILLVSYPDLNDWTEEEHTQFQFDVIVRNTGQKREADFKSHALNVIQTTSDYNVICAIDGNYSVRDSYTQAGIPFVFNEHGKLQGTMGMF